MLACVRRKQIVSGDCPGTTYDGVVTGSGKRHNNQRQLRAARRADGRPSLGLRAMCLPADVSPGTKCIRKAVVEGCRSPQDVFGGKKGSARPVAEVETVRVGVEQP